MKRAERNQLRAQFYELKIQLIDQGCKTLRDAVSRDYETFVQLVRIGIQLKCPFTDEVLEVAGIQHER